jgi:hypothetical protein
LPLSSFKSGVHQSDNNTNNKTRTSPRGAFLGGCFFSLHTLFERLVFLDLLSVLLYDLSKPKKKEKMR